LTLPEGDADYSGRWRRIKGYFSSQIIAKGLFAGRRANGELALWQRRYWEHTIRDDADFSRHADYIHFNPVRHGLVTCVSKWPHSSFHRFVRQGILPDDWGGTISDFARGYGERED
jgi:putative transposase